MKVKLVGVRSIDFTTNQGKEITGIKLYISYPEDGVYGQVSDSRFISQDFFETLDVTDSDLLSCIDGYIDLDVNPKGKLMGIRLCEE